MIFRASQPANTRIFYLNSQIAMMACVTRILAYNLHRADWFRLLPRAPECGAKTLPSRRYGLISREEIQQG